MYCVIIDGTGPTSVSDYDAAMKGSFCAQIAQDLQTSAKYYRGTWNPGQTSILRVWGGLADIISHSSSPLYLVGYSRGGAAAIELAHYCRDEAIHVEAMFLFDPVKRDLSLPNAGTIPRNVGACYQVIRESTGDSMLASLTKTKNFFDDGSDKYARGWFGNCGQMTENPNLVIQRGVCNGSHGAAGGVPWGEYTPDFKGTGQAASFMSNALQRHGLNIHLNNYWKAWHRTG